MVFHNKSYLAGCGESFCNAEECASDDHEGVVMHVKSAAANFHLCHYSTLGSVFCMEQHGDLVLMAMEIMFILLSIRKEITCCD